MKKKIIVVCVSFCLLFFACWYWVSSSNKLTPRLVPPGSSLPQKEIVFMPLNYTKEKSMSFTNSDGKGLESLTYEIPVPFPFKHSPIKQYEISLGRIFTWSLDGKSVGGIFPTWQTNGQGYPIVVHEDGKISYCEPEDSIIAKDEILVLSENEVMAIEIFPDSEKQYLEIFNMDTCQISKYIYIPQGNEALGSFSYTKNHWLALGIGSLLYWQNDPQNTDFVGIRIYDPTMKLIMEIKNAYSPSLSKDGKKIAYINDVKEICFTEIEIFNPKCNGEANLRISWSPDGKQIVYSNFNDKVVILDITTGEETIIADGFFPDWRP